MVARLSECEWRVLKKLNQSESLYINEIVSQSGVSYPSLIGKGGIIKRFLSAKWVKVDKGNKKRKKVQITIVGKEYFEKNRKIYDEFYYGKSKA